MYTGTFTVLVSSLAIVPPLSGSFGGPLRAGLPTRIARDGKAVTDWRRIWAEKCGGRLWAACVTYLFKRQILKLPQLVSRLAAEGLKRKKYTLIISVDVNN